MYNIQIYLNGQWVHAEAFFENLTFTDVLHNKLKPADSSLSGTTVPTIDLLNKLRAIGKEDIRARMLKDGLVVFTGFLMKTFTINKAQRLDPVTFEIISPSAILKRKAKEHLVFVDKKISDNSDKGNSILHQVLVSAGLQLSQIYLPDINVALPLLKLKRDEDQYHSVVSDILFEYGYVLDFDKDGNFVTQELFPDTIVTSKYFNGLNCDGTIRQQKNEEEYDAIKVEFKTIKQVNDQVIFSESAKADANNKCNYNLKPNTYFGNEDEWLAEYKLKDRELIISLDPYVDFAAETGVQLLKFEPGYFDALISIYNSNATEDRKVTRFDIKAKAFIVGDQYEARTGEVSLEKQYTYKANHIHDEPSAAWLSKHLCSYYKFADFTYKLSSRVNYPVGTFIYVSDTGLGTALTRIVKRIEQLETGDTEYELEAMAEFSNIDTTYQLTIPNKDRTEIDIANRPTYIEVLNCRFETRYTRSVTQPDTPTGSDPAGWTITVPGAPLSDPVWMSGANKDFNGDVVGTWYTPVRFTGAATILGILTNDNHVIATDDTGTGGNYNGCESSLRIYEGSVDTTSLWIFGALVSEGITGAIVGNTYTVTDMTTDSGYVDITASRVGMSSITKRFTISKSKAGAEAPIISIRLNTPVMKIYPDQTKNPAYIVMKAQDQYLANYDGIFKILINGYEWYESHESENQYLWDGVLYPSDTLYPSDALFPHWEINNEQSDVQIVTIELWDSSKTIKYDSQNVAIIKDVGFQIDDIANAIDFESRIPKYLGRFMASIPSTYIPGDWFMIYDSDDSPYQRGVYRIKADLTTERISGDSSIDATYFVTASPDILWAVANGYGALTAYGSITYIANLASNSVFTSALRVGIDNLNNTLIEGGKIKTNILDVDTILGENAVFRGTLQANTGVFKGSIESGPLVLNLSPPATNSFTINGYVANFVDALLTAGIAQGVYKCSGTYAGYTLGKIAFSRSAQTVYIGSITNYYYTDIVSTPHYSPYFYYTYTSDKYQCVWAGYKYQTNWGLSFYDVNNTLIASYSDSAWSQSAYNQLASNTKINNDVDQAITPTQPTQPTDVIPGQGISVGISSGTVSFVANSYTMKWINLPGYSGSLPQWTTYIEADGSGNYTLKLKG